MTQILQRRLAKISAGYNKSISERLPAKEVFGNAGLGVTSEYSMWGFIFQEIANLRVEVSRLSTLVRLNNEASPNYLEMFHAHLYSLMIDVSPIITPKFWEKLDALWINAKYDIDNFLQLRKSIPNRKIPFELIRKLDKIYRVSLRIIQMTGLGIKISANIDESSAMQKMITGS